VDVGDAKSAITVRTFWADEMQNSATAQGKDLMAVPSAPKQPGPWTGRALAQVMEWQLEHPTGTKEECIAWLDEKFTQGLIDLSAALPTGQKRLNSGKGHIAKKVKR
jgi:tRNA nucleotidyltransferase (CCA-adding enzyme)